MPIDASLAQSKKFVLLFYLHNKAQQKLSRHTKIVKVNSPRPVILSHQAHQEKGGSKDKQIVEVLFDASQREGRRKGASFFSATNKTKARTEVGWQARK